MKTKLLLFSLLVAWVGTVWAQGPNNTGTYYQSANGKSGSALKTALYNIIKNPHVTSYDGLYNAYIKTDTRPDGYVRDWYSNTTNYRHNVDNTGGYKKEGDMYNREHSVPQSWFGSGNIKSDVVHVLPTDGYVNNRRGNLPLAEVNNVTYASNNDYSKAGSCKTVGYTGTVFEPNDEIKGDMARIYLYMATCYQDKCASWGHDVFSNQNNGFTSWYIAMLMRWSEQDPVDEVEIARNNAVYEVQGNRNPFVDYPGLEDYIWGDKTDVAFSYDNYSGGEVNTIARPVFSPDEGTYYNSVEVTLSCRTEGATIYYTTNGEDASEQSLQYTGAITLTESATIKAVAIKDGERSAQSTATYTIKQGGGETPVDGEIKLNDSFFGTSFGGSIPASNTDDLTGTQDGVTVVYSLGSGANRYCNDSQIRLYPGNTLTVSVQQNSITNLEFVFAEGSSSTQLEVAGNGLVDGKWSGDAQSVTVSFAGSSKHARIEAVKVTLSKGGAGIDQVQTNTLSGQRVIYNLRGQRVANPTHGIYIVDGRKVIID